MGSPDPTRDAEASTAAVGGDAVAEIANALVSGKITSEEAVNRLVARAMDSQMTASAPAELRTKLEATLRAMIETDPHLRDLAKGLGAEIE